MADKASRLRLPVPPASMRERSSRSSTIRAKRVASAPILAVNRATTSGSSSPSSVSARRLSAPRGVFSSWLRLATKSRRTASRRRSSETSSTRATAPSGRARTSYGVRPDLEGVTGGGVKVEGFLVERAAQGSTQRSLDRLLGQEVTVPGVDQVACGRIS